MVKGQGLDFAKFPLSWIPFLRSLWQICIMYIRCFLSHRTENIYNDLEGD